MRNIFVHITDGKDTACAFLDYYLNKYTTPGKAFYDEMLKKAEPVKHNFTILCIEWLRQLAEIDNYDDRNKVSVMYARNVAWALQCEPVKRCALSNRGAVKKMMLACTDCEVVQMLENYLRLCEDNQAFIQKAICTQKIFQQKFARVCGEWFRILSELPPSRKAYVKLAKKANQCYEALRYA